MSTVENNDSRRCACGEDQHPGRNTCGRLECPEAYAEMTPRERAGMGRDAHGDLKPRDHSQPQAELDAVRAVVKAAREVSALLVPRRGSRGPRAFYRLRDALAAFDNRSTRS